MNLFDQTPLTVYLVVVFGVAALSIVATLGVVADAALRTWRSHDVPRTRPDRSV